MFRRSEPSPDVGQVSNLSGQNAIPPRIAPVVLAAILCGGMLPGVQAQETKRPAGVVATSGPVFLKPLADEAPVNNAALFVGINEFPKDKGIETLSYAVNDAVELAFLFVSELKLIPAKNCYLCIQGSAVGETAQSQLAALKRDGVQVEAADKSSILVALNSLLKVAFDEKESLVVAGLSTHGIYDLGVPYVIPSDGVRADLGQTALPLTYLEDKISLTKAGHRLLLIDACQERIPAPKSLTAPVDPNARMRVELKQALQRKTGQAKLASCRPGERSFEHPSLNHGVFTHAVLAALRGEAQPDDRRIVRLDAVISATRLAVNTWEQANGRDPQDQHQTISYYGEEIARSMPLAARAEDAAVLAAMLRKKVSTEPGGFSQALCDQLAALLPKLKPEVKGDHQVLRTTRAFVAGRMEEFAFVPFLKERLRGVSPPPPPSDPPALLVAPFNATTARSRQAAWAAYLGRKAVQKNAVGMELTLIPPGEYRRGSSDADVEAILKEEEEDGEMLTGRKYLETAQQPQHAVRISRPFYMGTTEVTQAEFQAVMNRNPSFFKAPFDPLSRVSVTDTSRFPVETVSWFDAAEFCNRLSARESLPEYYSLSTVEREPDASIKSATVDVTGGAGYRLPTEAEWEYACRAGTTTAFHFGDQNNGTDSNINGNSPFGTMTKGPYLDHITAVASYPANGFGLRDMHGNVREWCADPWEEHDYWRFGSGIAVDPIGAGKKYRIHRGGSYYDRAERARSADRSANPPELRNGFFGFRVVLSARTQ